MAYNIYSYDKTQPRYQNVSWTTLSQLNNQGGHKLIVKEIIIGSTTSHLAYLSKGNSNNIEIKHLSGPIINDAYIFDSLKTDNCHITYTVTDRLTVDDLEELGYDQLVEDNRMGYTYAMNAYVWFEAECKEAMVKHDLKVDVKIPASNRFKIGVCGESAYLAFDDERILHVSGTSLLMKHAILMHQNAPMTRWVHEKCTKDEELIKLLETFGHIFKGLNDEK